jgi:exosortase C (VPDSG-CTERM-specific)
MNNDPVLSDNVPRSGRVHDAASVRLFLFAVFVLLLSLSFFVPFKSLASLAMHDELHSHVFLVPAIACYILYIIRDQLPKTYRSSFVWATLVLIAAASFLIIASKWNTYWLTATILSFVCFLVAGGFACFGKHWMKVAAFPFAFLLFMAPLPVPVVQWLETASKLASADCARFFFYLTGTPVLRDGTIFQLPGIVIEVAQECSGIRSSWVLFIASILASYLFLRRPSHRVILVLAAVPLGVLRNGFRIAVIGLLCIRFGPQMIHHPIHRRGGPLFFVLSLIPLIAVLWALKRREDRSSTQIKPQLLRTDDGAGILSND